LGLELGTRLLELGLFLLEFRHPVGIRIGAQLLEFLFYRRQPILYLGQQILQSLALSRQCGEQSAFLCVLVIIFKVCSRSTFPIVAMLRDVGSRRVPDVFSGLQEFRSGHLLLLWHDQFWHKYGALSLHLSY
jgi:hypothetical protein